MFHQKRKPFLVFSAVSFVIISLTGCTGLPIFQRDVQAQHTTNEQDAKEQARINDPLIQAAKIIQDELQKLNTVTLADAKPIRSTTAKELRSPELRKKISITWVGDTAKAVKSVSALIGWSFLEKGTRHASPSLVKLDEKNQTAYDILQRIGLQAGRNTGVIIDEKSKTIIISYLGEQ